MIHNENALTKTDDEKVVLKDEVLMLLMMKIWKRLKMWK